MGWKRAQRTSQRFSDERRAVTPATRALRDPTLGGACDSLGSTTQSPGERPYCRDGLQPLWSSPPVGQRLHLRRRRAVAHRGAAAVGRRRGLRCGTTTTCRCGGSSRSRPPSITRARDATPGYRRAPVTSWPFPMRPPTCVATGTIPAGPGATSVGRDDRDLTLVRPESWGYRYGSNSACSARGCSDSSCSGCGSIASSTSSPATTP